MRNDADVLTGNVSGEAMTPGGNIFADAMRGTQGILQFDLTGALPYRRAAKRSFSTDSPNLAT